MKEIVLSDPSGSAARTVHVRPFGDSALLVHPSDDDKESRWRMAHALAASLRKANLVGVEGITPTFESLTIEYDPLRLDVFSLCESLTEALSTAGNIAIEERLVEIPLVYGGDFGPDLTSVAGHLGISENDVIEKHCATMWRLAFNGAPAGAPMHEGDAFGTPIPRMSHPRVKIPAGSVAVSGHQGTIYTIPAPGGWRLIGTTPLRMNNPSGQPFVALTPGDTLRFVPISVDEFHRTEPVFIGELL
ncbi:sensor histidine kinase inhibitor, KipI family [Brevibacterium sandarakinum]|uniref:Carboxyltransferase domain-containing protein n=2 Tax=Brevibacterium TaxID=1696 RepID=A0A556C7Z3_BREAU|nr:MULTISPECIES: carboxyltransferase domain-containing protein [Brevibacterium]TSI13583.1 carboxyltransferase domain-containing protein [Brevibacterium aurantiacum]SDT04455.1 sensor histidine kinase inhibitor, KipI family [Brevibacterium sandarakinum]